MKIRLLVGLLALGVFALSATAAPIISVGAYNLAPNTPGQIVHVYVTGTDQVTGFNLQAQLGDGTGPNSEPVFQAVTFTGGIWDAYANTAMGGPVSGAAQFAQASVAFNTSVSVPANGLLLDLVIDTTGFTSGTYPLLFKSTEIGTDSDFLVTGGGSLAPNIVNGSVTVPEPATLALFALGGLGILRRRRLA